MTMATLILGTRMGLTMVTTTKVIPMEVKMAMITREITMDLAMVSPFKDDMSSLC